MSSESTFNEIKAENPNDYMDIFELDKGVNVNLFQQVVPCIMENFFGTYTCNILVLDGPYAEFDSFNTDKALFEFSEVYHRMAKYECHIIINESAEAVTDPENAEQMTDTEAQMEAWTDIAQGYGLDFFYHGKLGEAAVKTKIQEIILAFEDATR